MSRVFKVNFSGFLYIVETIPLTKTEAYLLYLQEIYRALLLFCRKIAVAAAFFATVAATSGNFFDILLMLKSFIKSWPAARPRFSLYK